MDTLKNMALSVSQIHKWSSSERKLNDLANLKSAGEKTKNIIKPSGKTTNEIPNETPKILIPQKGYKN